MRYGHGLSALAKRDKKTRVVAYGYK